MRPHGSEFKGGTYRFRWRYLTGAHRLLLVLLLLGLTCSPACAGPVDYRTSDGALILRAEEEFQTTFNPHAVLSLMSEDKLFVIVTVRPKKYDITRIFDGAPFSFPDGAECVGRVLLSVDGEDAPTFLVEGLFPPEEPATHSTLYAMVNRGESEYTIMIHYPIDLEDEGFEWAAELLRAFRWVNKPDSNSN